MSGRFDYPALLRAATVGIVRQVLAEVAEHGLEGDHHFFLTFRTGEAGVRIPAGFARRYPEAMTVVLQHQFVDLEVDEEAFAVTLRFGGAWERVRVPFRALTTFLDPSVPFGLDFTQFAAAPANSAGAPAAGAAAGELPKSGPFEPPTSAPGPESPGAESSTQPSAGASTEPDAEPASGDLLPFRRR